MEGRSILRIRVLAAVRAEEPSGEIEMSNWLIKFTFVFTPEGSPPPARVVTETRDRGQVDLAEEAIIAEICGDDSVGYGE
jgi:hypothetical protein